MGISRKCGRCAAFCFPDSAGPALGRTATLSFTRTYAYAVASILFMHLLVNVGMVLGLAPVIGIPLPFFSYGGSSLMGFTLLMGILIRLDAERFSVLR